MVKWTQKKKVMIDVFFFLVKFNLYLIPFYAIIYFDIDFYPQQIAFTNFLAWVLKALNYPVETSGFMMFIGESKISIDISRDCIGWKSVYSIFALVFATTAKIKDKLKFLAVWMPVLFIINIFRVLITMLVGLNFGYQYIEFIHTFLWQQVMILAVLAVFYLWLKKRKLLVRK